MVDKKYMRCLALFLLLISQTAFSQNEERDYLRKGNRLYNDSVFVEAEINYRKALEINPKSTIAMYNLANTLFQQNKLEDAIEQYMATIRLEKNKENLALNYHNMGVIFHSQKEYLKAIEAYKQSLRNNPKDNETRYNLALAQKMLNEENKSQQQNNSNNQQEEQEKQKKEQNQQQQLQQEQQNNNMSKENAEQLLKTVMQDEREIQDKVKRQQTIQGGRLEKDW